MSLALQSDSEDDTRAMGRDLAQLLRPGDVVALQGPLGAGKTRFVQAVAAACGCDQAFVVSPTFTLIHEYEGRLPVYHVDAYRLQSPEEFLDMGGGELLEGDGVCLIEWADRIAGVLPRDHLRIEIQVLGPERRRFQFQATGPLGQRILELLAKARGLALLIDSPSGHKAEGLSGDA